MLFKNQRIFDVFLSSTQRDLIKLRETAITEIRASGHRALAMEFFDAQDRQSSDFISDCISKCDIFIVIIGKNFGSMMDDKSFVEFEYEIAKHHHKPILAFVPHNDELRRAELPDKLIEFRSTLMATGLQASQYYFDAQGEFQAQFARSLNNLAKDLEEASRGGWIRSEELNEYVHLSRVPAQLSRSTALRELVEPICEASEIVPNIDSDIDEKSCITRFFWRLLATSITAENGIRRLFLDGGSTTYYACKELNEFCGINPAIHIHKTNEKLTIGTNSTLNFLELSNNVQGPIRYFKNLEFYPTPPVNRNFGKSFGTVGSITPQNVMQYQERNWTFRDPEGKLAEATEEFKDWLTSDGGYGLSVISCAGFIKSGECAGPWVKSHASMLMQSCLFRSRQPVALIIDGAKWDLAPEEQQGYHVLIDDLNLEDVIKEHPFAFAVATLIREKADEIQYYFEGYGMKILRDKAKKKTELRDVHRILAYNEKFSPLTR